jgi:hypothetical protein
MRPRQDVREQDARGGERDALDLVAHRVAVVVSVDERHRREHAQGRKHVCAADIAGMHDVIDGGKHIRDARMNESVRVRDDPDAHTLRVAIMTPATPPDSNDPRILFEYFSNEYAQALQAYATIETQAATLHLMGYTDDLRTFIDQFLEMAQRIRTLALEKNELHFADWFEELIGKAEKLKGGVTK